MTLNRRGFLGVGATAAAASLALPTQPIAQAKTTEGQTETASGEIPLRAVIESFSHPYWYESRGNTGAAKAFWDKDRWEKSLTSNVENGYNAVVFSCDPWLVHQWQTWLIPHNTFPEARDLPEKEQEKVIEHVRWIFEKSAELGLQNILMTMFIVTTPAFAKFHGIDVDMEVSDTVDWRHNYQHVVPGVETYDKMSHWGVRNELTRAFTEAAMTEVLETYPELHGFRATMGEALPGKRSSWFREAVAPGIKKSGRKPLFLFNYWMVPVEEAIEDIVPEEVYDNTWIDVSHNGEIICDPRPFPMSVKYAEETGLPVCIEYVAHNVGALPWNSPKYAHELLRQARKIDQFSGFLYMVGGSAIDSPNYDLFGKALAHYGKTNEPYSDDPWVALLEKRFGNRESAQHFLNAYNLSGEITPRVNAIAWSPHDGRCTHQLNLKYWHWTDQDIKFSHYVSPSGGLELIPIRYYAKVVAKFGESYRNNNGSDYKKFLGDTGAIFHGHPGAQELIWGHIDYQMTPEQHMAKVREFGKQAAEEAEKGLAKATQNQDQARKLRDTMKAYDLLTAYYEKKVHAAVSALIYHYGGNEEEKSRALALADETFALYEKAMNFIYKELDNESGNMKGGWWDEQRDLMGLIETERKDREEFPELFRWDVASVESEGGDRPAELGTTLKKQEKE